MSRDIARGGYRGLMVAAKREREMSRRKDVKRDGCGLRRVSWRCMRRRSEDHVLGTDLS